MVGVLANETSYWQLLLLPYSNIYTHADINKCTCLLRVDNFLHCLSPSLYLYQSDILVVQQDWTSVFFAYLWILSHFLVFFFFIPKKSQKKIQSNVRNGRTKPKYWYQEIPWRQKENKNITLKGLCQALCMILSFCMLTTVPACQPQKIITFVFDQKNMWEKSTSFVFQRIKKALSYILNVYNDFIEDTVM